MKNEIKTALVYTSFTLVMLLLLAVSVRTVNIIEVKRDNGTVVEVHIIETSLVFGDKHSVCNDINLNYCEEK